MISKARVMEVVAIAGFVLFGIGMVLSFQCVLVSGLRQCGIPLLMVAVGTSVGVGGIAQRFLLTLS